MEQDTREAVEHLEAVVDVSFDPTPPEVKVSIRAALARLIEVTEQRDELLEAAKALIECEEVIDGASRSTKSAVRFKHLAEIVEKIER